MEFKAIIDAKARTSDGCAVVGVYEDGELGIAARQIDAQLNGLIAQTARRRRFLPQSSAMRCCCRRLPERRLRACC